jgi:Holliday junction resolvase RusA-like endonuclease
MIKHFRFEVEPIAKQSMRAYPFIKWVNGKPKALSRFTQQKSVVEFNETIKYQLLANGWKSEQPYDGIVFVHDLTFVFPACKYHQTKHKGQKHSAFEMMQMYESGLLGLDDFIPEMYVADVPDIDNCQKAIWDAVKGMLFSDDRKIVRLRGDTVKIYGTIPRIEFTIEYIE